MISVIAAHKLVKQNYLRPTKRWIKITDAVGFVMAEDVHTPLALPPFNNSAMDGFVLKSRETRGASPEKPVRLKIRGTIKAGDSPKKRMRLMEAYRIMTGAAIPPGGDAVIVKEIARVEKNHLLIFHLIQKGHHVRCRGEELKKGTKVLSRNQIINPGTVGFLASIGRKRVRVFRKPKVSVIATGSELTKQGQSLVPGKIYDSNSAMISAAIKEIGVEPWLVRTIRDTRKHLRDILPYALRTSDVVVLTGGVSVGDYDYVKEILKEFEVRTILWKVSQKPGKPLYMGRKKNTLVFGLPGNPASAFTCFYEYVYPIIRRICGFDECSLREETAVLRKSIKGDSKRFVFLKGKVHSFKGGKKVLPLPHQGSHMISSLHETNSFVLIPPKHARTRKGTEVKVHLLPHGNILL